MHSKLYCRPRLLYPGHVSMTEISTGLMSKKFLRGTLRVKRWGRAEVYGPFMPIELHIRIEMELLMHILFSYSKLYYLRHNSRISQWASPKNNILYYFTWFYFFSLSLFWMVLVLNFSPLRLYQLLIFCRSLSLYRQRWLVRLLCSGALRLWT